mgnify:CR=1 FL=1
MFKKLFIFKIILLQLIGISIFQVKKTSAFIPLYNLPSEKNLRLNGSEIGKNAYQLLYFGHYQLYY